MNNFAKVLVSSILITLVSCQNNKVAPVKESRATTVELPVSYIHTPIIEKADPILEIEHFDSTKLVINTNRLFHQNDIPLRMVSFQKYSSSVFSDLIAKIKSYPEDAKIEIKCFRFGNYSQSYLKELSTIQAKTVAAILWDYGNIDQDRISIKGMGGEGNLVVPTNKVSKNVQNNRIEITLS